MAVQSWQHVWVRCPALSDGPGARVENPGRAREARFCPVVLWRIASGMVLMTVPFQDVWQSGSVGPSTLLFFYETVG